MGSLKALILLANGVSATELIPPMDILRRALFSVTVAGVEGPRSVTSDTEMSIAPDMSLEQAIAKGPFDLIVVPGGEGAADIIAHSKECAVILTNQLVEKRVVAALGAGCLALMKLKLGKGKKISISPHFAKQMKALNVDKEWNLVECDGVVIDGCLASSQGSLFAMDFSFDVLQKFVGKKVADELAEFVIHKRHQRKKFAK